VGTADNAPFPMDVFITVDQRLDPDGDDLPIGWFVEAKAAQAHPLNE